MIWWSPRELWRTQRHSGPAGGDMLDLTLKKLRGKAKLLSLIKIQSERLPVTVSVCPPLPSLPEASYNGSTTASQRSQVKLVCVTPQKLLKKTGWIQQRDGHGVLQVIYPSSKHLGPGVFRYQGFQIWGVCRFYCWDYLKCILLQNPKIWGLGLWDSQHVLSLCFRNHVWANVWVTTSMSSYTDSVKFWLLISILIVFNHSVT